MREFLVLGLLTLLAPVVGAASITHEEFLAVFGSDHVAARGLEDGLARAEAARKRAGALPNPRVELWHEQPEANPQLTNWTVAWTPPFDGRYGLGKQAAEKGLSAAQERLRSDLDALRRDASLTFAAWSFGRERRELLYLQLGVVAGLAQQQRERATVGEESGLAARRFALAADEVRSSLREAEAAYLAAEATARAWRPDLPSESSPAVVSLPEPPSAVDASDAPELRALASEMEQAGLDARRAERFWGFPTIQLGWQTLHDGGIRHDGPIIGVGWTVPLVDRDKAARWEAARRKGVVAARLEWTRARMAGQIRGRLEAYRVLFQSVGETQAAAHETERILESVTASFRAGEASLTDLLETLRSVLAVRLREIDARAGALEAYRALEAALGRPLAAGGSR